MVNAKNDIDNNNNDSKNFALIISKDLDHKHRIYRYKFTPDFVKGLTAFAKLHRFTERKAYKEAWADWLEINRLDVNGESKRLQDLGYKGDVELKMFKAARYYFGIGGQKVSGSSNGSCDPLAPGSSIKDQVKDPVKDDETKDQTRPYVSLNPDLLELMDTHIVRNLNNTEYSPANGYIDFCDLNVDFIKNEIKKLCIDGEKKKEMENIWTQKFKKAYKNRYYQYTQKLLVEKVKSDARVNAKSKTK